MWQAYAHLCGLNVYLTQLNENQSVAVVRIFQERLRVTIFHLMLKLYKE